MSYLKRQSENRGLAKRNFALREKTHSLSSKCPLPLIHLPKSQKKNLNKVILGTEKSFIKYQTSFQSLTLPVRCCQQVLEITSLHYLADAD